MRPQLPIQPNPNPNNKAVQVIDIQNQPAFPTFPAQCNDIHLRSGKIVEPIIDDVISSDSDKEENEKHDSHKEVQPPCNKDVEITEPPFLECF